ncbi:signal transduction histidine kinase [Lentzea atacamensis]|uniref:histidine kinase n=1 Tax=Lentzea atacamensis TaxID=531938 RepID=A0A316HT15_9PSEU|nr:HAMP domain-containing sensor histidine kinase [Lentzea atacamensis]PWK83262.1 signal transduction histidine kinase [Lentzea atacamensis]RAS65099.1 signal transduction histidine kinase [Lentzea atacamensis]
MTTGAAARLRGLRWLLTGLFTALNATGVLLVGWLLLDLDEQKGEQALDADLRRVPPLVVRHLEFKGGDLDTRGLFGDSITVECPQFAVLPAGEGRFDPYVSGMSCVDVDLAVLSELANDAVRERVPQSAYVHATNGKLVRVYAQPFISADGPYVGAVVAHIDAQQEKDRHDRRVLLVALGCVILIGALGGTGHFLSGLAIRPAAIALEQHEEMLNGIAHDLKRPVTGLRALADTAMRNPGSMGKVLPRIMRLAKRMGGIVSTQLMHAKFEAGVQQLAIQSVQLDQLVSAVVEDIPADGARITFTAVPTRVDADPDLIGRAVENLIGNAVQHGHLPGSDPVVHVSVANGRVVVADEGPGLDTVAAQRALQRFTSSGGSTGLGLYLVQRIVHAHGGTLGIYRSETGGAIFEIALPTGRR